MSALGNLYKDDEDTTESSVHEDQAQSYSEHTASDKSDSHREEDDRDASEEPDSDDSRVKNDGYGSDSYSNHQDNTDNTGTDQDNTDREQSDREGSYHEDDEYHEENEYREDDEYHDDEYGDPEKPMYRGYPYGDGGMTRSQSVLTLCCCVVCFLIALMLGAIIGALLADSDTSVAEFLGIDDSSDDGGSDGASCPPPPIFDPQSTFACLEDNVQLEFRITFDSKPGDVGVRVYDVFNTDMWNFPAGSFASISLLRKENVFSLCLSPDGAFTFELTDSANNGLKSSLGADIFGSFTLLYGGEIVTTYNGDCNSVTSPLECGDFSICTYSLAANTTSGNCTVVPDQGV